MWIKLNDSISLNMDYIIDITINSYKDDIDSSILWKIIFYNHKGDTYKIKNLKSHTIAEHLMTQLLNSIGHNSSYFRFDKLVTEVNI